LREGKFILFLGRWRKMKKTLLRARRISVALLIESSRSYGRGLMLGVAQYVRTHGPWSILLQEQSLGDAVPDWLKTWQGDGIITRLDNAEMAEVIQRLRVPVVYVRNAPAHLQVPVVKTNNEGVARLAFEHLRERGFRHFAFCGFSGADYSNARRDSFVRFVTGAGLRCHVFEAAAPPRNASTVEYECEGMKDGDLVAQWLKELPKPAGLMACNDMRGQQVLEACRAAAVSVPDEVGVVGVDNDEVLCDLSDPPLSSVQPDAERVGFEAAALLDRIMAGERPPLAPVLIDPKRVVTRRSTEVFAIEDRQLADAIRFIRNHACGKIDVNLLAKAASLSRSTLERRFARIIGRSPKGEILRVRLDRAKQLLTETDSPLELIAEKIGFEHTAYLSRIFKKKTGITPSGFRFQARAAAAADKLPLVPSVWPLVANLGDKR
jgi:LacI family transcriptional regulator, galactose operon repressor